MNIKTALLLLVLTGCSALGVFSPLPATPNLRPVQYLPGADFDSTVTNGMDNEERKTAYSFDYGIQYLPTNVLLSLKRPDSSGLHVLDELLLAHPERFGLLPNFVAPNNPLPIGITKSIDPEYAPMSGINCLACHTSMISNANGQFFLVDGGSSRFAIDRFIGEMIKAMVATLVNPVEFEAFYARYQLQAQFINGEPEAKEPADMGGFVRQAYLLKDTKFLEAKLADPNAPKAVIGSSYPTSQELSTKSGMYLYLAKRLVWFLGQVKYGTSNDPNVAESGLGRSNPWSPTKKMLADKYLHSKTSYHVEGGPVNTPFVWDHDRQRLVFWAGNTNSMVERNMAQAVALLTDFNQQSFATTASIRRLETISQYVRKAHAPSWPQNILGPINMQAAYYGKLIYQDKCLGCHDPKANEHNTGSAQFNYYDVGTDDSYYQGQIEMLDGKDLFTDILTPFMSNVKAASVINERILDMSFFEKGRVPVVWIKPTSNKLDAKPLAGIWATPPFLHNGSVPTIWDLLQPVSKRPTKFHIGGFVYDSVKLGYIEDASLPDGSNFVVNCPKGCVGNSNKGHEFGTNLSDDEKKALIEFLKSYDEGMTF